MSKLSTFVNGVKDCKITVSKELRHIIISNAWDELLDSGCIRCFPDDVKLKILYELSIHGISPTTLLAEYSVTNIRRPDIIQEAGLTLAKMLELIFQQYKEEVSSENKRATAKYERQRTR